MKLIPLFETDSDLKQKLIDYFLERIKKEIVEDASDIQQVLDNDMLDFEDAAVAVLGKGYEWTDELEKLQKAIDKMSLKAWEQAFKAKYGVSDLDMLKKLNDEFMSKHFSPNELKFWKDVGSRLIATVERGDFNKSNELHVHTREAGH